MTAATDIILIDDDHSVLDACREVLELEGFQVSAHSSMASAMAELRADTGAVIVSDVRMPGGDGLTFWPPSAPSMRKSRSC
ncbi:response regulator [Rhizobium sp. RCAM05350]|nr:response regulator [Rhizobium sp. RCAM05350]